VRMLGSFEGYLLPAVVHSSIEEKYTLYPAVQGKNLNRVIMEGCLLSPYKLGGKTRNALLNLGKVLGLFHSYNQRPDMAVLSPTNLDYLRRYLERLSDPDPITERIGAQIAETEAIEERRAWVHGNIKSEDIFVLNSKISIIDFGTCGEGSPYEDLAGICAYMVLLRGVPFFPWRRARQACDALLTGYRSQYDIEITDLKTAVTEAIYRYYLKNIVMHAGYASLSGMPVSKSRITRLVLELLDLNYESAFEGTCLGPD